MNYHPLTKKVYPTHGTVIETDQIIRKWLKEKAEKTNSGAYQNITDLLELTQEQTLEEKFKEANRDGNVSWNRLAQIAKEHYRNEV